MGVTSQTELKLFIRDDLCQSEEWRLAIKKKDVQPSLPLGNLSLIFLISSTIEPIVHGICIRKVKSLCGYV
jgi:hypothetical protein